MPLTSDPIWNGLGWFLAGVNLACGCYIWPYGFVNLTLAGLIVWQLVGG